MVLILFTRFNQQLNEVAYRHYMNLLPATMQEEINRYHFWQDSHRSLFGKILLVKGLEEIGLSSYSLEDIQYTAYQRPYFSDVDFNISHSGDFVICAISITNTVGIDVEEVKEITFDGFEDLFSTQEMNVIIEDKSLQYFYTLWTQKEAFLKAIGKGLYVPLNQVQVKENTIDWEGKKWHLHKIELGHSYLSHLCTDTASPEFVIKQIRF